MPPHLEPQARRLLKELQLEHKVSIENGAFTTLNLSQGQRKRLALLVALLEDRAFYVFDGGRPLRTRRSRRCSTEPCCRTSRPGARRCW